MLHAAVFDSVTLVPEPADSTGAAGWENLVVRLGGDTLTVRRLHDTTLVAALPHIFSGTYEIEVFIASGSGRVASAPLDIYGLHEPSYWAEISFRENYRITEAIPWPPGNLISYNEARQAVVVVGLLDGSVNPLPGLHYRSLRVWLQGMLAPGVSYRAGHAVLDLGDTTTPPCTWDIPLQPLEPTACADTAAWRTRNLYSVAELPEEHCLGVHEVWRVGARVLNDKHEELVPADAALLQADFRLAPDGSRAVLLAARSRSNCRCALAGWPVFSGVAQVQYAIADYAQVPGAAFSPDGLTLYVAGDLNFEPDQFVYEDSDGPWVLDARHAADGGLIQRRELAQLRLVYDVLPDPLFPRVYVAGRDYSTRNGVVLVLDRATFEEVGRIRLGWLHRPVGMLVHGGSTGSLFLALGNAGADGELKVVRFDIMP